jgi:hypothetical protein
VQSSHISLSSSPSPSPTADVPDDERCVVGWITVPKEGDFSSQGPEVEHQLIALTYAGGWYRLSLPSLVTSTNAPSAASHLPVSGSPPTLTSMPRPRTSSGSSMIGRFEKGKEKDRDREGKESRHCVLQEYRRFGRWDGWG